MESVLGTTLASAWWCCLNAIQATRCMAPMPSGVRPCPVPWPSGTALFPHVLVSVLILQSLSLLFPLRMYTHTNTGTHTPIPKNMEQVHKNSRCLFILIITYPNACYLLQTFSCHCLDSSDRKARIKTKNRATEIFYQEGSPPCQTNVNLCCSAAAESLILCRLHLCCTTYT